MNEINLIKVEGFCYNCSAVSAIHALTGKETKVYEIVTTGREKQITLRLCADCLENLQEKIERRPKSKALLEAEGILAKLSLPSSATTDIKPSHRKELEEFNRSVAKKFKGYADYGIRPACAYNNSDKTPYTKFYIYGEYGRYCDRGEPDDTIFVPTSKANECEEYLKVNLIPQAEKFMRSEK